ncbi:MAG: hypothetical protein ACM3L6_01930 [Deltaproteobacteria bacterium]
MLRRLRNSGGVVMAVLAVAAVCSGLAYLFVRERGINTNLAATVAGLEHEQVRLQEVKARLEKSLADREEELKVANTKNYRDDMVAMQDAFKEANQKLGKMVREHAELQNSNFILESRLANTTKELTQTIDELKMAREMLGGIENPYKTKMNQLSENLKKKEQEYVAVQGKLEEAQRGLLAYEAQGQDYAQGARKYQDRLEVLSRNIANLKTELIEKSQQLSQKDVALADMQRELDAAHTDAQRQKALPALPAIQTQREDLQAQVAASGAELAGQQEALDALRQEMASLHDKLYDREAALAQKEQEVRQRELDMKNLQEEMAALRAGKEKTARRSDDFEKARRELQDRIDALEKENAGLKRRLAEVEASGRDRVKEDPYKDRNLRLMTEQLVKKEEEIQRLSDQVAALTKEKGAWERSLGPREKRMAELEILVNTLTKQLGDYSAMIEKRDADLRGRSKDVQSLTEDLEAQKMAALALQKELAESRARQEQTLQKLTQLMSMNTAGVGPDDMKFDLYGPASGLAEGPAAQQEKSEDPAKARARVDKLKRQVEVMMERR